MRRSFVGPPRLSVVDCMVCARQPTKQKGRESEEGDAKLAYCTRASRTLFTFERVSVEVLHETVVAAREREGLTGPEEDKGEAVADGSAEDGFGGFQEVPTRVGFAVDEGVERSDPERDGKVERKAVQVGQAEQTGQRSGDASGGCAGGGQCSASL